MKVTKQLHLGPDDYVENDQEIEDLAKYIQECEAEEGQNHRNYDSEEFKGQGRVVSPSRVIDNLLDYDLDDNIDILVNQFNQDMQINRQNDMRREQRQNNNQRRRNRRRIDEMANSLIAGVHGIARNSIRNPFARGANQRVGRRNNHHEVPEDLGYEDLLDLENRIGHVSKGYASYIINCIPI